MKQIDRAIEGLIPLATNKALKDADTKRLLELWDLLASWTHDLKSELKYRQHLARLQQNEGDKS